MAESDLHEQFDTKTAQMNNTIAGIRSYSLNNLSDQECNLFARAFQHFMTPNPRKDLTGWVGDIMEQIEGTDHRSYKDMSDEERIRRARSTLEIAESQVHLLNAQPVTYQVEDNFKLHINYFSTTWDGSCGGIKFRLEDADSKGPIDSYAIIGIPHTINDIYEFDIHTMQPWLRDDWPAISQAYTEEDLLKVKQLNRLNEKLLRKVNEGKAVQDVNILLAKEDIYLLTALSYLQKNDVRKFKGRLHDNFPYQKEKLNHNYDEVFSRWFQRGNTNLKQGWSLDAGIGGCYIPNFIQLPAQTRKALLEVYN